MKRLTKVYPITAEFLDNLRWIRPIVEKSIFKAIKRLDTLNTIDSEISAFFEKKQTYPYARPNSIVLTLSLFDGFYSNDFFREHSIAGFIYHTIELPSYLYESFIEQLKKSIIAEIIQHLDQNEKIRAIDTVSKALDIGKFITLQASRHFKKTMQQLNLEKIKNNLRKNCHDISNQASIIDGVARFLIKDPERLETEIQRLEKIKSKIMSTINNTRESLTHIDRPSFNVKDMTHINPFEVMEKAVEFLYYHDVPTRTYFNTNKNKFENHKFKAHFFTILNLILINVILEIIKQTARSSNIFC